MTRIRTGALTFAFALALALMSSAQAQPSDVQKLNHVVVIFQENWSFDSLYGKFPGANGLDNAAATTPQVDKNGEPYVSLPQPSNTLFNPPVPDPRFPANLPVAPFDTTHFVGAHQQTG